MCGTRLAAGEGATAPLWGKGGRAGRVTAARRLCRLAPGRARSPQPARAAANRTAPDPQPFPKTRPGALTGFHASIARARQGSTSARRRELSCGYLRCVCCGVPAPAVSSVRPSWKRPVFSVPLPPRPPPLHPAPGALAVQAIRTGLCQHPAANIRAGTPISLTVSISVADQRADQHLATCVVGPGFTALLYPQPGNFRVCPSRNSFFACLKLTYALCGGNHKLISSRLEHHVSIGYHKSVTNSTRSVLRALHSFSVEKLLRQGTSPPAPLKRDEEGGQLQ